MTATPARILFWILFAAIAAVPLGALALMLILTIGVPQ